MFSLSKDKGQSEVIFLLKEWRKAVCKLKFSYWKFVVAHILLSYLFFTQLFCDNCLSGISKCASVQIFKFLLVSYLLFSAFVFWLIITSYKELVRVKALLPELLKEAPQLLKQNFANLYGSACADKIYFVAAMLFVGLALSGVMLVPFGAFMMWRFLIWLPLVLIILYKIL